MGSYLVSSNQSTEGSRDEEKRLTDERDITELAYAQAMSNVSVYRGSIDSLQVRGRWLFSTSVGVAALLGKDALSGLDCCTSGIVPFLRFLLLIGVIVGLVGGIYCSLKSQTVRTWGWLPDPRQTLARRGYTPCLLYTSPSPRDKRQSRMPSSA